LFNQVGRKRLCAFGIRQIGQNKQNGHGIDFTALPLPQ
jgi:hypothetical protein